MSEKKLTHPEFQIGSNLLTPSELVWMFGNKFAEGHFLDNYSLTHLGARVSSTQLMRAIMATAFLVNEKIDTLHFEVHKEKKFFNLLSVSILQIFPGKERNPWTKRSLEYSVCYFVDRLNEDEDSIGVDKVVYLWIGAAVQDPWKFALKRIERSVYVWEQFDRHNKTEPVLISLDEPNITDEVLSVASKQSISFIQNLLMECEVNRKTVWDLIIRSISSGIGGRHDAEVKGITEGLYD
jgi:hypothetical protein